MTNKDAQSVQKGLKLTGAVKSIGMVKTVVVAVQQEHRHPLYKKAIRRSRRFSAHNESFDLAVGDRVVIAETKPISKTKHFTVIEKITK